jgi:hypothetical protein
MASGTRSGLFSAAAVSSSLASRTDLGKKRRPEEEGRSYRTTPPALATARASGIDIGKGEITDPTLASERIAAGFPPESAAPRKRIRRRSGMGEAEEADGICSKRFV